MQGSSPPLPKCGIQEFCKTHNLGPEIADGLERLGFYIRDDLEAITMNEWECYNFEDIVLGSDEYLNSRSEKLRGDPQE